MAPASFPCDNCTVKVLTLCATAMVCPFYRGRDAYCWGFSLAKSCLPGSFNFVFSPVRLQLKSDVCHAHWIGLLLVAWWYLLPGSFNFVFPSPSPTWSSVCHALWTGLMLVTWWPLFHPGVALAVRRAMSIKEPANGSSSLPMLFRCPMIILPVCFGRRWTSFLIALVFVLLFLYVHVSCLFVCVFEAVTCSIEAVHPLPTPTPTPKNKTTTKTPKMFYMNHVDHLHLCRHYCHVNGICSWIILITTTKILSKHCYVMCRQQLW